MAFPSLKGKEAIALSMTLPETPKESLDKDALLKATHALENKIGQGLQKRHEQSVAFKSSAAAGQTPKNVEVDQQRQMRPRSPGRGG